MPKARKRTRSRSGPNKNNRSSDQIKGTGVSVAVATNFGSRSRSSTIRVAQTERIGTVNGSVNFSTDVAIKCNPGLVDSFPWLSAQANLYEQYRFCKLVFRYKNLKGSATDGNILMSFDYDSLDSPPSTALEVTQMTLYQDGAPWRMFSMNVPCGNQWLYTRQGPPPQGGDLKTYDLGQLFLSSEACADASIHGYLEVDYVVDLQKKQPTTRTPVVYTPSIQMAGTSSYNNNPAFTTGVAIRWGSDPTSNAWRMNTNSAIFGDSHGQSVITLKSGWYKLDLHAVVTLSNPSITGTLLEWYVNGAMPADALTSNTTIQVFGTDIEDEAISATRLVLIPAGLAGDVGILQLVCTQTDPTDFQYTDQLQLELVRVADAPATLATPLVDARDSLHQVYPPKPKKARTVPMDDEEEKEEHPTMFVSEPVEIPRLTRKRSRRSSPAPSHTSYDGELVTSPANFASRA